MIARAVAFPGPQPHPTRMLFVLPDDAIENPNRRVDCLHESECLDLADARHWPGFSCARCDAFTVAPWAIRQQP